MTDELTHLDDCGRAHMVDVTEKSATTRMARATCVFHTSAGTLDLLFADQLKKGDAIATARIAGIQAAKKTSELIPLCHPVGLGSCRITIDRATDTTVEVLVAVKTIGQTGVEMEALSAAATTTLTLYDMTKSHDRGGRIEGLRILEKSGGKSGTWKA